jgi:hypothetical protein
LDYPLESIKIENIFFLIAPYLKSDGIKSYDPILSDGDSPIIPAAAKPLIFF